MIFFTVQPARPGRELSAEKLPSVEPQYKEPLFRYMAQCTEVFFFAFCHLDLKMVHNLTFLLFWLYKSWKNVFLAFPPLCLHKAMSKGILSRLKL